MSYPTQPAFVHVGTWNDQLRSHPTLAWMEKYTATAIDGRAWEKGMTAEEYHTADFSLQRADGSVHNGAEAAWKELQHIYGHFSGHKHRPELAVVYESEDGWEMIGHAKLYVRFAGKEETITDDDGDKWNAVMQAAYHFRYVKDSSGPDGIKLKQSKIFSDPMPAVGYMLKTGIVKPQDLGLA